MIFYMMKLLLKRLIDFGDKNGSFRNVKYKLTDVGFPNEDDFVCNNNVSEKGLVISVSSSSDDLAREVNRKYNGEADLIRSRLVEQQRGIKKKKCLQCSSKENVCSSNKSKFDLYHVSQHEHWDCGVACLQYTFQWLRFSCGMHILDEMQMSTERNHIIQDIGTRSIWTSDLVCVIHRKLNDMSECIHGSYLYCSKNFSVPDFYGEYEYYKSDFRSDSKRVRRFFETSRRLGYQLYCSSNISLVEIQILITTNDCLAICLVDNSVLMKYELKAYNNIQAKESTKYTGHYIVIKRLSFDPEEVGLAIGSSPDDQYCFVIENPACENTNQFISPKLFGLIRQASGTDEDIIFIMQDIQ